MAKSSPQLGLRREEGGGGWRGERRPEVSFLRGDMIFLANGLYGSLEKANSDTDCPSKTCLPFLAYSNIFA